ncbi:valine--tRNA ligase [Silvanigrella aquatica]|uniref:Valine--tRNA ligase n=1 Tax=Silvanigrella aquatica TaxID=1915309 RepID=A0A1L4D350_9BACT|nr:valine--tRNA ligase [Silvanigrella aquatica]APJ04635.1 valine--tRNA ligase [Silvanigrella aquatica]
MTKFEAFTKAFDPSQVEEKLRNYWNKNHFYKSTRNPNKKPYTIVMPPPNVTGDLTMGHMMFTLQDILIRWHRAKGFEACWIPGTDHASIATEAKVTNMLKEKGISKKEIGREKFLEHAWEWKEKYGGRIEGYLKTLGISCDWSRNTFTMDEKYSSAVIKGIVKLYKNGLIYKSHRLVNWCPVSQSVISDEEVLPEERNGSLWHIRYVVEDNPKESLIVATTRPETLFGDLAIAVHPSDDRYAHLIGKNVIVPICNRKIPIIADHYVEKDFGTGVLKITPAHDMNDFEVGKRHNLGLLNILHPDARLNDNVPESYRGLDRYVARKKLVIELEQVGLLDKIVPHKLVIGISERGNVPIEYYLSEQWYIKMDKMAEMTLDATRSGRLKLIPAHQEKTWEHWLTNIQDWCISRQLWWGHRLPIYTCDSCSHVHCEERAPLKCHKCGHGKLTQDEDVLDTWASSWLWPFGVHNWANPSEEEKLDLEYYYPTDVIVTGADIIFFWIARMVMAGEYFTQETPFKHCYFTPIVRDAKGRKMSKSLGNSPDVTGIMTKYGTDAMRFSLVNQIVTGQDIFWSDDCCELGKTFANKIWNATRFLTMNAEKLDINPANISFDNLKIRPNDEIMGWITSEFFDVVRKVHDNIARYEFSQYSSSMYEFIWMTYCDWFVELLKPRLSDENNKKLAGETLTLAFQIFDGILRIMHPIMPFITEEIWQQLNPNNNGTTLGFAKLPEVLPHMIDENSIQHMREVQAVVVAVRAIRGKFNIHPATELTVYLKDSQSRFGNLTPQMEALAKAKFYFATEQKGFCAPSLVNNSEIFVSLEGLVDRQAERDRLLKKIEKVTGTISGVEKRLSNTEFVKGAPMHILEGAKKQLADNQKELEMLQDSLKLL